jgi:PAS domain S-box-containing protein
VVAEVVKAGSRSRSLVPGALDLVHADGTPLACRSEACVYRPASAAGPAVVMLRLSSKQAAARQFVQLNQRLGELVEEVTRRKRAEIALQAVSERLRVTLASIGDAVVSTDVGGRVTFSNAVADRLMGLSEPPLGRPLQDVFVIVNETTRQAVESPVDKVLRLGQIVGLANHTVLLRPDGSELAIDDSGAPIRDQNGRVIGVVMVFRDVSQRRALERELQQHTRELEAADRRKDEFLSMLAHELRNPLAPLATSITLLDKLPGASPQVGDVLQVMRRQVGHMTRLVDDLLDVARLTRGSIELRKARIDLADVVAQAIEMGRAFAQPRGVRLEVLPSPSLIVDADLTRLVQVLSNLLSNAAKFTSRGGTVTVSVSEDRGWARMSVRDTGAGIDPALLPRIFDLFVQGDRSLDRRSGGLGIGLTIVRSIVELHGGSIHAASPGVGQGAEFVVRLPLTTAGATPARSSPVQPPAQQPLRILVVDDNADALQALAAMLALEQHVVRSALDGDAALRVLDEFAADAVLLDIGLPGMNGYELARQIRSRAGGQQVLLVAISGYGSPLAKQLSLEAGIDMHVTKPVDHDVLMQIIRAGRRPGEADRSHELAPGPLADGDRA